MMFRTSFSPCVYTLAFIAILGPSRTWAAASDPADPAAYPTYVEFDSNHRISQCLDGVWQFATDPENNGVENKWFAASHQLGQTIQVPGAWQAQGVGEPFGFNQTQYIGAAWYKRTFEVEKRWPNQRVWLKIGAVHPSCDVWVNGQPAGLIRQPGMPTKFDMTDYVRTDGENDLTIRVHEENRGLGNWYNLNSSWSGIWRSVTVETTQSTWIDDVFIIPDLDEQRVMLRIQLQSAADNQGPFGLRAEITDADGNSAANHSVSEIVLSDDAIEFDVPLKYVRPWSTYDPHLYRLDLELHDAEGRIDHVSDRFGMRKISTDGVKILLNDEPQYLRGVGDDGMYPLELHPETDPAELRRTMRLIKACGFNYVYPCLIMQPEEYLDAADEVGLLVQYDAAALLAFQRGGPGVLPEVTTDQRDRIVMQQWLTILRWTQNHPSLVIYSPGSELLQEPVMVEMYKAAKAKDPSRLVLSWSLEPNATDITDVGDLMHPLDPSESLHEIIATWKTPVPGLIHEYIGAETLADPRLIPMFTRGMEPVHEKKVLAAAQQLGIEDKLEQFVINSQKLANSCRKLELEEARKVADPTGYNMWLIQDIPICPQGIFDAFWQPKEITPAELALSAGDSVLVMHESRKETRRCFEAGEQVTFEILASHFGQHPVRDGRFTWRVNTVPANREIARGEREGINIDRFFVGKLCDVTFAVPHLPHATEAQLSVSLKDDQTSMRNHWRIWLLPETKPAEVPSIALYGSDDDDDLVNVSEVYEQAITWDGSSTPDVLVATDVDDKIARYVENGGNLILIASGGDHLIKTQFMPRWPLSDAINISATIIDTDHFTVAGLPSDGYCDYQYYQLIARPILPAPIEGYYKGRSEAFNLDLFEQRFEPIVRVFHTEANCGYLIEARLGKGRVIGTTFQLAKRIADFPEARCLFDRFVRHITSDNFRPSASITGEELQHALSTTRPAD
jgi:hypothetical protein